MASDRPAASAFQREWIDRIADYPTSAQLDVLRRLIFQLRDTGEQVLPQWQAVIERIKKRAPPAVVNDPENQPVFQFFAEIERIDPLLADVDPRAQKLSFLLGAGASAPSDIPTVKFLLPELLTRARRLNRDDLSRLADFCEARKISNIEDLLTAAQIASFCSRNASILELFNMLIYGREDDRDPAFRRRAGAADTASIAFLQDTFQLLFGLLSNLMLPARPNAAHQAIVEHTKAHVGTSVVTTNYDCCIDLALGKLGKDYDYRIEFSNIKASTQKPGGAHARLIKMHGSLNWYYCETCQNTHVVDFEKSLKSFLDHQIPFPVIATCATCGGQRRGLLVPPLSMKFDVAPPLTPLLNDAREAFEGSDMIVAIGFSFAEADVYITRMLSKSMQNEEKQKLLIVDPDPSIAAKLKQRFGYAIPKFDTTRIMYARENCEIFLPRFLSGQLLTTNAGKDVGAAPS